MKLFLSLLLAVAFFAPVSALADATEACHVVGGTINPTETQGTNDDIDLFDGTSNAVVTNSDNMVAPVDLIAYDLTVTVSTAPLGTDEWVIYFTADGTRVLGLTCSIFGTTQTTCHTGRDFAVIPAGAKLTLAVDSLEGTSAPAVSADMRVFACLRRDI